MKKPIAIIIPFILLSIVCGCHHTQPITAQPVYAGSETLYQYRWNLMELNGQPADAGTPNTAFLLFYPGQVNRVSGSTGCNRLTGTFEISGVL
ncbi:MAG: META domain-containing protein [Segetibacter sp.]